MYRWPQIAVLLVTYNRPDEIRVVIRALQQHLRYPGKLRWVLADDGSPEGYVESIVHDFGNLDWHLSISHREGWGVNVNKGMDVCRPAKYIYLNEDDYVPRWDVDLAKGIYLLQANPTLGLVRYDGIAGHQLDLELREVPTPAGQLNYLRILKSSPALNVYSHRPHLKTVEFHQHYGRYAVNRPLGVTEVDFAHRFKDRHGPGIACLVSGVELSYDHIGVSRQGTELDIHA